MAKAKTELSQRYKELWPDLSIRYLVLATNDFVVFVDEELDVDWKTTDGWDKANPKDVEKHAAIMNRAAAIESAEWDNSDEEKTISFKRQIGEAIARCFEGNFGSAEEMLDQAEKYRAAMVLKRTESIRNLVETLGEWKTFCERWTFVHYALGIAALLFSTLVASKIPISGPTESILAWLVALFTGLLTFLTPDKKAEKYLQARSILDSQITRYNSSRSVPFADVLDARHQGEAIIFGRIPTERIRKNVIRRNF